MLRVAPGHMIFVANMGYMRGIINETFAVWGYIRNIVVPDDYNFLMSRSTGVSFANAIATI